PIPTEVPNDFLVASGLRPETEHLIVEALKNDPAAGRACTMIADQTPAQDQAPRRKPLCSTLPEANQPKDDFDAWYVWDGTDDNVSDAAREGLARLRRDARNRTTPVVVKVEAKGLKGGREDDLLESYVDAAREAVRLSGTEFVLEDRDLHKHVDMTWTLEATHDGALMLESSLDSAFG